MTALNAPTTLGSPSQAKARRYSAAVALLALLLQSGCSALCQCDKVASTATSTAATTPNTSTTDNGRRMTEDTPVFERPMAEAAPVGGDTNDAGASPMPAQFEQLLAQARAQESAAASANEMAATALPKVPRLQRRILPSEQQVQTAVGYPLSPYVMLPDSRKELSSYAKQMAVKLAAFPALQGARVGVASFVEFDEALTQTNALGQQFAENLQTLLPEYGVQVIEFKLSKDIRVGPRGDLVLSRNVEQLRRQSQLDYVLTGTLLTTRRGVQINSRVVSVWDHQVIAASSTFIPHMVLQQIQP
jgi:TolB-like protein